MRVGLVRLLPRHLRWAREPLGIPTPPSLNRKFEELDHNPVSNLQNFVQVVFQRITVRKRVRKLSMLLLLLE